MNRHIVSLLLLTFFSFQSCRGNELQDALVNENSDLENALNISHPKNSSSIPLSSGRIIKVKAGLNTLVNAAKNSMPGDIIELVSEGPYNNSEIVKLKHPLTVRASESTRPDILFEKHTLFEILNGGSLRIEGLRINGENAPYGSGNSVISTSKYSMNKNYRLFIENCEFVNLDISYSFDAIKVYKNTFADTISIKNSRFYNVTGSIIALDQKRDNIDTYNAEYVIFDNVVFKDIGGPAFRIYKGENSESSFGPYLQMKSCVLQNVGYNKRNKYNASISLHGVQEIFIQNNFFIDSRAINIQLVTQEPIVELFNNVFQNSEKLRVSGDQKYSIENHWIVTPNDCGDSTYSLSPDSRHREGTPRPDLRLKNEKG